ncbi:RNA-directed DNA polymerase, eukaryota [Tanacetum coccineum]
MTAQVDASFRRPVRGGIELNQFNDLVSFIDSVSLSSSHDRWVCNASGDGNFRVKDIRNSIDDLFLPSGPETTRWVKFIPIKINVFTWRARRDCLPTRANLIRRGVFVESGNCPICGLHEENAHHIFFQCDLAQAVLRRICSHPTSRAFWKASSVLLGGPFGFFGIVSFSMINLLLDRQFMMILRRYPFIGVKIDVNGLFLGRLGSKILP